MSVWESSTWSLISMWISVFKSWTRSSMTLSSPQEKWKSKIGSSNQSKIQAMLFLSCRIIVVHMRVKLISFMKVYIPMCCSWPNTVMLPSQVNLWICSRKYSWDRKIEYLNSILRPTSVKKIKYSLLDTLTRIRCNLCCWRNHKHPQWMNKLKKITTLSFTSQKVNVWWNQCTW